MQMSITTDIDIVDVISRYTPLKRMGSCYAGRCPFHGTNTFDAFRVSQRLQIFKCFNCGSKGNAIDFVMQIEKVDFKEALRILRLNDNRPVKQKRVIKKAKPADRNQPVLKSAVEYYKFQLQNSKEALQYLFDRGITDGRLIDRLNIGYASKRGLTEYLIESGYTYEQLLKEGIIRKGQYGYYDFFRNRIIFPVYDSKVNIRTITSRSIDLDAKVKHLHLLGDIDTFYNEPEIDCTYIIVVEGISDCLSLLQEGFKAVAIYGTGGLKRSMASKLKIAREIFLAFDRDENQAGQRGLEKALEIFKKLKIRNVYPIELPYMEGKKIDINDLFSKHDFTKEDFSELMEGAIGRKNSYYN